MLVLFLLSSLTVASFARPPPFLRQNSIYDNLPYLINKLQLSDDEAVSHYDTLTAEKDWPKAGIKFGQVSGVGTDKDGNVHVFHRAERSWTAESFAYGGVFRQKDQGPIKGETLLVLDKDKGEVKSGWGSNKFYMPHGLTVDKDENIWLTDVAMHQVFKFPKGSENASLVLGVPFIPGHDDSHFCKPTDVAVASNGVFFVSDGYCNSRIMKFSPDGTLIGQFGRTPYFLEPLKNDQFHIPHSLALIESRDTICVADRENSRIQCFNAGLKNSNDTGKFVSSVTDSEFYKIHAIAYDPVENLMYAVNGPNRDPQADQGFTINPDTWEVVDSWGRRQDLSTLHDLTVSPDGKHIYVAEIGPNRVLKLDRNRL